MTVDAAGLACAIEAHEARGCAACVDAHRRVIPDSRAESLQLDGACAAFCGVGSPLSRVVGLGIGAPVDDAALEHVVAFYRDRGASCQIELSAYADSSLLRALAGRPSRPRAWKLVMVHDLAPATPAPLPPGITIEPATDVELWARTVEHGFSGRPTEDPRALDIARTVFALAGARCLLARIDGVPAGGGFVAITDGWAALASGSTLPAFRGRGVQQALVEARLALARAAGCQRAIVSVEPGTASHRNMVRGGFRDAVTRIRLEVD